MAQTGGGRFTLDNFDGSIEITGWDQNIVNISGTKYAESQSLLNAMRIEVSSSGNAVRAKTTRPDPHHGNMGAKYVIRVPRQTTLEDVASSNGSIRAEEIDSNADLTTSNGSIHLGRIMAEWKRRSITVRMPASVGASLHASTNSNGSARSDFDVLIHA